MPCRFLAATLLGLSLLGQAEAQSTPAACKPSPLGARDLFLRGTMNGWAALDGYRFQYRCDRYELLVELKGEQRFKVADEDWSADADFGGSLQALQAKGGELSQRFAPGHYRLQLRMDDKHKTAQALSISACPAAPLGDTTLFLRGTMNNWAALDDYAFQYRCDAYELDLQLSSTHEFKIADAAWSPGTSFAAANGGNHSLRFDGAHTLRMELDERKRPRLTLLPRRAAAAASTISDPLALSLRYNSRSEAHKSPFGAQPAGTRLDFMLDALPGVESVELVIERRRLEGNQELLEYSELARLAMQRSTVGGREQWRAQHRFIEPAIYGYYFVATIHGRRYVYQNNKDSIYWTREKGSMGPGLVEEPPADAKRIRRYRQTIHAADFQVPSWARDIVYYYVFPERFRNGNKANDPQPGRDRYQRHSVELHQRWNEKPFKPGSGDGSDSVFNNDFFGGDLQGIIDKLDYIRELGANTLYMTPVFRAPSNHKYDTADFKQIDPAFGSNADFQRLTGEAAQRGIRVIPDTSLNHVGSDSPYFNRFGNYPAGGAFDGGRLNPASPYASWFKLDPSKPNPEDQYQGWVGVKDLPELDKQSKSFRAFAYGEPDSVMKHWLDQGAAGWRMDVAPWVPDDFWREWRAAIKAHKPDALTIAETWFDASKYFLGDSFDSTMNYIFRNTVLDYAAGGAADKLYANLELLREAYPPQALFALMNLLSSHDQPRALHHFGHHDDSNAKTLAEAKQRLRLALLFQMIYPGAPTIYYGDEVGLGGGDDPDNRRSYPWADEGGQPDTALLADFKRLTQMRQSHPVLRHGSLQTPLHLDAHVIVLARQSGQSWALTATNNATTTRRLRLALPEALQQAEWRDALDGRLLRPVDGHLELEVTPLFGRVLLWN